MIVGRICMDQVLNDISELEEDTVKTGDVWSIIFPHQSWADLSQASARRSF